MNTNGNKLALHRHGIRTLNDSELRSAHGGRLNPPGGSVDIPS